MAIQKVTQIGKIVDLIIRDHFGLDPKDAFVHFELIERKKSPEKFDEIQKIYKENLASHPNKDEVRKRLYVGDDLIVHLQCSFPRSDVEGLKDGSALYYPICTLEEIRRIENPRNGADMLLQIRADAIADEPRMIRIFLPKYEADKRNWTLTQYFDDSAFAAFIERLSEPGKGRCAAVSAGFAFLKEPNGVCLRTRVGDVIVVSESLKYFLYYMNLFALGDDLGIGMDDRNSAFTIGVRTMLMSESLDFDIDSRGELDPEVDATLRRMTDYQLQFIVGHEYGHLLLGHLSGNALARFALERVSSKGSATYYSPKHQQELEADLHSVKLGNYGEEEEAFVVNGALLFFSYLHLYDTVSNYLTHGNANVGTHPDPMDRFWSLRGAHRTTPWSYSDDEINNYLKFIETWRDHLLKKVLPFYGADLERYGSIYLPTFKKTMTVDRFDY